MNWRGGAAGPLCSSSVHWCILELRIVRQLSLVVGPHIPQVEPILILKLFLAPWLSQPFAPFPEVREEWRVFRSSPTPLWGWDSWLPQTYHLVTSLAATPAKRWLLPEVSQLPRLLFGVPVSPALIDQSWNFYHFPSLQSWPPEFGPGAENVLANLHPRQTSLLPFPKFLP